MEDEIIDEGEGVQSVDRKPHEYAEGEIVPENPTPGSALSPDVVTLTARLAAAEAELATVKQRLATVESKTAVLEAK